MQWESLISTKNLKLAWRRINTGSNLAHKRFFREAYLTYESAVDEHLKGLHKELKAGAWKPKPATRLYLPKPSGLQRPLSLLGIEDQIVLQAIANQYAIKLGTKRRRVELKSVFSNKLTKRGDSIFFMENWRITYGYFQDKCSGIFKKGLVWSVHFDLAAYYDTISHDLLLSIVSPNSRGSSTLIKVKEWFRIWSTSNSKTTIEHGIPQGPIASDFLAEAFLLPIDLKLQRMAQKGKFQYIRYVDDIRIFGRSENAVRKAAIHLEHECRHCGLIPHNTKFSIRKITSASEAMGSLPSIPPMDGRDTTEQLMDAEEALKILKGSLAGRPQKIKDKSRFRYVMYRAPKNTEILNIVLRLLPRHPEHIDAFISYFGNYNRRPRIAREVLKYLKNGVPYSYVRGELWHVVARLAGKNEMYLGLPTAREDSRNRKNCMALSWGVMSFLIQCEKAGLSRLGPRLKAEHPMSRALLAPIFPDREFSPGGQITTLLKGNLMEQLAGARALQKRKLPINALGLKQTGLQGSCLQTLKSLGVVRRHHRITSRDWIDEKLNSLYECKVTSIWWELLESDYEHANQIMIEAEALYHMSPSSWLPLQDSFFDVVTRKFFEFLVMKNIEKELKIINKNGELIKYGVRIGEQDRFAVIYPEIANSLRIIHKRRNEIPASHPYGAKGGAPNKWLKKKEQKKLVREIKNPVDAIAAIVKQNQ